MTIHRFEGREAMAEASRFAADLLEETLRRALRKRRRAHLTVPGGRSPALVFQDLGSRTLPWARVDVVPADERRVGAGDARRNDRLIRRTLLAGRARRARLYAIADATGRPRRPALPAPPDACLVAMGDDGHIASLFAGATRCRADDLIVTHAPSPPRARISWDYRWLAGADRLVVLVFGAGKAALFDAPQPPGRLLPVHRLLALSGPTAQVIVAMS